jgi:hypothetical protein
VFTFAYDEKAAAAVFLFSGGNNDDADFERYLAAVDKLVAVAVARVDAAIVTVVDRDNPPPNAKWRARIGQQVKPVQTHAVGALVSESPIVRGVVTVLNWVAPKRYEEQTVVATFDEAVAWIEARRGPRRLVLQMLLRESRAEAARRAKVG